MSDQTTTTTISPPQPARPIIPPRPVQNYAGWKRQAFTALKWQSTEEKQKADRMEMADTCVGIIKTAVRPLPDGVGATLRKGAGDTFKTFQDIRTKYEDPTQRTPELAAKLTNAANAYITHFEAHDKKRQRDPNNIQKRDLCQATIGDLKKLDLAAQINRLPMPPWDSGQAADAAGLKVRLDLASLPPGQQHAEYLESDNVSPAFWINKAGPNGSGKSAKTFIFKPATDKPANGFPANGEPAREAMAGKVAGLLNDVLGMKIPVPNTQVVTLAKDDLPADRRADLVQKGRMRDDAAHVGSVQQFESTDGAFNDECGPRDRARLDQRSVQELAVFDLITLNTDRHEKNFLIKNQPLGRKQLIPIDHGNCFPELAGIRDPDCKMADDRNALMSVPAAHEKFSPEMLVVIGNIDPDGLAGMLKRERDALAQLHGPVGTALSDDAIDLSKRAAMFLKQAAGDLSPAAIQFALRQYASQLFDPTLDAQGFADAADDVIDLMQDDQVLLKEWHLMPADMKDIVKSAVMANQWSDVTTSAILTMKLWKNQVQAPATPVAGPVATGPLSQQEWDDCAALLRLFPNTPGVPKPSDVLDARKEANTRRLLALFAEWNAIPGSLDDIEAYFKQCGSLNPSRTGQSFTNISSALPKMRLAAALPAALAKPPVDAKLLQINLVITAIGVIAPALPPAETPKVMQVLAAHQAKIGQGQPALTDPEKDQLLQDVTRLHDGLISAASNHLLQRVSTTEARLQTLLVTQTDDAVQSMVTNQFSVLRDARAAIAKDMIVGALDSLTNIDRALTGLA